MLFILVRDFGSFKQILVFCISENINVTFKLKIPDLYYKKKPISDPMDLTNDTRECKLIDLEFANWPLLKSFILIFEVLITLLLNAVLPRLCKDITCSTRLRGYMKLLIGVFIICQWINQMLRLVSILKNRLFEKKKYSV